MEINADIFKKIYDICLILLDNLHKNLLSIDNEEKKIQSKDCLNNLLVIIKILKSYDIKEEKTELMNEDKKFLEFLIKNNKLPN